jgi:hypothetical protein
MRVPSKPGLYPDLPFAVYHQIEAKSSTMLRDMGYGARTCWHRRRFAREVTPAMLAGRLAHIQILEPLRYIDEVVEWDELVMEPSPKLVWEKGTGCYATECHGYQLIRVGKQWQAQVYGNGLQWHDLGEPTTVTFAKRICQDHSDKLHPPRPKIYPDGSTKLAPKLGARYDAFVVANPGREVVVRADLEKAARIERAVRDNPEARDLLGRRWRTEYSVVWEHAETGARCKARIDWLTDPRRRIVTIGEVKTGRDISERAFNRASAQREYHAQLEWYGQGLRYHFPDAELEYVILAVENHGAHDCTVFDVGTAEIEAGHELNEERLQDILDHEDEYGDEPWPGRLVRTALNFADYAPWALSDDDDDGAGVDWS